MMTLKRITTSKSKIIAPLFILFFSLLWTMPNEFFFASSRVPYSDLGVYQYIGVLINQGQFPYIDVFDHKGPILYFLYAIGCRIDIEHGMWVINYAFMCGIMGASYIIARKFVSSVLAMILCLIVFSDSVNMGFQGGTPEFYSSLFIAIGLWILTDYYLKSDITRAKVVCLGICIGVVFWLKHLVAFTLLVMCFFIIVDCLIHKKWDKVLKYLLHAIIGFALISSFVCAWVLVHHAGEEMLFDYFIYNLVYAGNDSVSTLNRLKACLFIINHRSIIFGGLTVLICIIIRCFGTKEHSRVTKRIIIHTSIALCLTIIVLSIPAMPFAHYITTLFPVIVLLSATAVSDIESHKKPETAKAEILCVVIAVCIFAVPNLTNIEKLCQSKWTPLNDETKLLIDIDKYANETDTIIIDGFHSFGLYVASNHNAASKYPYTFMGFTTLGLQEEYQKDIRNNEPAVILCRTWMDPIYEFGEDILSNYDLVDETTESEAYYVFAKKDKIR